MRDDLVDRDVDMGRPVTETDARLGDAPRADSVTIRQGAATEVIARRVDIRQGAVVSAEAAALRLDSSVAGAVLAEDEVVMDMSAAGVVIAKGDVTVDQSAAVVLAGRDVYTRDSSAVFVVAARVNGTVRSRFGPVESLIFGAAAGLVLGGLFLLPRLFSKPASSGSPENGKKLSRR